MCIPAPFGGLLNPLKTLRSGPRTEENLYIYIFKQTNKAMKNKAIKKGEDWVGVDGWVVVESAGPKFITYHYVEGKNRHKPYRRPTAEFLKYFIKSK